MRKIFRFFLPLVLISLVSCASITDAWQGDYNVAPSWTNRTPSRRGRVAFVGKGTGANETQSEAASYSALLEQVSAYLGYDVQGQYYRELSSFGTISDLSLAIDDRYITSDEYYILAYADESVINSKRSEEYQAIIERDVQISALLDAALEYYKTNNDVDAVKSCLDALIVAAGGPVQMEEHQPDILLERAMGYLKNIELRLSRGNSSKGEVTVRAVRNKGLLSPSIINAPIKATFPIRTHKGESQLYSVPFQTGEKGTFLFKEYYPVMLNAASVTFSLDLGNSLEEVKNLYPEGTFEEFESQLAKINAVFSYDIVSEKSQEGILLLFNEFDDRGADMDEGFAKKAFTSYLENEGIKTIPIATAFDDFDDMFEDIKSNYPEARYLIWGRVGCADTYRSTDGRNVWVSEGYTMLIDLSTESIIVDDDITQSVYWGNDREEALESIFSDYGRAVAEYFIPFLG